MNKVSGSTTAKCFSFLFFFPFFFFYCSFSLFVFFFPPIAQLVTSEHSDTLGREFESR